LGAYPPVLQGANKHTFVWSLFLYLCNNKNKIMKALSFIAILMTAVLFHSCEEDVNEIDLVNTTWSALYPEDFEGYSMTDINIHQGLEKWSLVFDETDVAFFITINGQIESDGNTSYYLLDNQLFFDVPDGFVIDLEGNAITLGNDTKVATFHKE
jgi:hypothetical protein